MTDLSEKPLISFIIPAFNEEKFIANTIKSITNAIGERHTYEIIVIDNGSTDKTPEICIEASASTHIIKGLTIGELRNIGVKYSHGDILIFIDADVTLTEDWAQNIDTVLNDLHTNPMQITGSRCTTPDDASWVAKAWFNAPNTSYSATHMGTGHMITSRKLFLQAGGFPEAVPTGEDYIFCTNAKEIGAKITSKPNLRVIHHGVPKTLGEFIKRETWHGIGDWLSMRRMATSKVAILTLVFLVLHIAGIIFLAYSQMTYAIASLLCILSLCVITALIKYKHASLTVMAQSSILFYFYFLGRSYSIARAVFGRSNSTSPRVGR